ncbi:MAG: glycoside hydrolase family 3 N-terminal domain-containing protein [Spirochaetia bacterium]
MKRITITILILILILGFLFLLSGCNQGAMADTGTATANAPYKDPSVGVDKRVENLLGQMTLAEKIGQMTQVARYAINPPNDITTMYIGSILSGGGDVPRPNTPEGWDAMMERFQGYALKTRLGIPLVYGADGVHGHNNLRGAVIFPQNIGLGAADDPDLMERIGRATAEEMAATGVYWNFAPVVAVPQDIRWGRTYEGYSENTKIVSRLAGAYIRGLQNNGTKGLGSPGTVLATAKHFIADGGTEWGTSIRQMEGKKFMLDQGVAKIDEATLRRVHLPPYIEAIKQGVECIMVSFSSWKDTKMHAQKYLLTDVLKGELGFKGFLISDWQAIDQISPDYYKCVVSSINAGLDMIMVPDAYEKFIKTLTSAVEKGDVPLSRIDDAVRRILRVKFKLGLFERPPAEKDLIPTIGSKEHRDLAREAVRKSLVLLKNQNKTLPLAKDSPLVLVAGRAADDIGIQCGGWTITWQGKPGAITDGTTILEGIRKTMSNPQAVTYDRDASAKINGKAAIGIAVVGELPYAEGVGDKADLNLSREDVELVKRMRSKCDKLVLIVVSGRPLIISRVIDLCDAVIAAWLPGTEGQGVADVVFGDFPFTGKLSYGWPGSMKQIPLGHRSEDNYKVMFPFGFGLR